MNEGTERKCQFQERKKNYRRKFHRVQSVENSAECQD